MRRLRTAAGFAVGISASALADSPLVESRSVSPVITISREELESLPGNRDIASILKALPCQGQSVPALAPNQILIDGLPARGKPAELTCLRLDDLRLVEIYKGHNDARAIYGSQPLLWDADLARGAAAYAGQLTSLGRVHAPREGRKDVRENLLQSLRGGRTAKQMVDVWVNERTYFRPGIFPDVSTTGDWSKVGHYTQIVWPSTWRLGCAIHSDARYDWTVCRYSPPGNRDGTYVGERATEAPLPTGKEKALHDPPMPQPRGPASPEPTPPVPTAADPAPAGYEFAHPLYFHFENALEMYKANPVTDMSADMATRELALRQMRYAYEEMRKRFKAAKAAGDMTSVKPENVKKVLDYMEAELRKTLPPRPR